MENSAPPPPTRKRGRGRSRSSGSAPSSQTRKRQKTIIIRKKTLELNPPDIVLYINAHGGTMTRDKFPYKIYWHSVAPENGCLLYSNRTVENEKINILKDIYTENSDKHDKHQRTLDAYCNSYEKEEYLRNFMGYAAHKIQSPTLVISSISRGEAATATLPPEVIARAHLINDTFFKQNNIVPITQTYELREFMRLYDIIVDGLNSFMRVVKRTAGAAAALEATIGAEFFKDVKLINSLKYQYTHIIKNNLYKTTYCNKFMRINVNKYFIFTDTAKMDAGIYIIYDETGAIAPDLQPSYLSNIPQIDLSKIEHAGIYITLRDIVEFLQNHGYKHIAVYDNSCNYAAETEYTDRTLSPIAHDLTLSQFSAGGVRPRRWRLK